MVRFWHNRCSMLKNYWHFFFFFDKQEEINSLLSFIYVKSPITIILTSNALIRQKCHRIGIRYGYQWDTNTNVLEKYWAKKKINFLFWYDLDTFEIQRVPIRYWRRKKKKKKDRNLTLDFWPFDRHSWVKSPNPFTRLPFHSLLSSFYTIASRSFTQSLLISTLNGRR